MTTSNTVVAYGAIAFSEKHWCLFLTRNIFVTCLWCVIKVLKICYALKADKLSWQTVCTYMNDIFIMFRKRYLPTARAPLLCSWKSFTKK